MKGYSTLLIMLLLVVSCTTSTENKTIQPQEEKSPLQNHAAFLDKTLGKDIVFDWAERSFSPMYSNIGMVFSDYPGFLAFYFHYNYKNRNLKHIIKIPDSIIKTESSILGIKQVFSAGEMNYAFYDQNSFIIEIKGYKEIPVNFNPPEQIKVQSIRNQKFNYGYQPWLEKSDGYFRFRGFMNNRDSRDPDPMYPIAMGVKVIEGQTTHSDEKGLKVSSDSDRILLAFHIQSGDLSKSKMTNQLNKAPQTIRDAQGLTANWLNQAVGTLPIDKGTALEQQIAAKAVLALTFNACTGSGYFEDKIATFPNRGNYATQYEWDTAFQNLAYEMMESRLAEDAISILTESQRPDGKMGQFVTSTYLRPTEIQVPLIGWATERLYRQRKNTAFIKEVLPKLVKNIDWIYDNRMTRFGLASALSPWELWDDTPRLDDGPILACDFNADLLMQIRACEFLANEIGDRSTAAYCKTLGDDLAQKIIAVLYDKEDNVFRDVLVETGEKLDILTPANFVPLLANVPIPREKAKAMIQTYLLDENKFFGSVPFPSVAYDEPTYVPHKPGKPKALTWRGPTWMPMAWMMMEVLKSYEFEEEYWYSMNRIYQLMLEDGELHELFNSQTGEGIGIPQLGWTSAIFLKIKAELEANNKKSINSL